MKPKHIAIESTVMVAVVGMVVLPTLHEPIVMGIVMIYVFGVGMFVGKQLQRARCGDSAEVEA